MNRYYVSAYDPNHLQHHGVLGMKWGIRRYQNKDGSLTAAGAKRYGVEGGSKTAKQYARRLNDLDQAMAYHKGAISDAESKIAKYNNKQAKLEAKGKQLSEKDKAKREEQIKKKDESNSQILKGRKETQTLIDSLTERGWGVNSKEIQRDISGGKQVLTSGLMTAIGNVALNMIVPGAAMVAINRRTTKGTAYKVNTTDAQKAKTIHKTAKKDKYDSYASKTMDAVSNNMKPTERKRIAKITEEMDRLSSKIKRSPYEQAAKYDKEWEKLNDQLINEARKISGGKASKQELDRIYRSLYNIGITNR